MKRMETDKVIVIEKTGYRSEDIISCNGVARCIRNHGYRGGDISNSYEQPRRDRLYRRAVRGGVQRKRA